MRVCSCTLWPICRSAPGYHPLVGSTWAGASRHFTWSDLATQLGEHLGLLPDRDLQSIQFKLLWYIETWIVGTRPKTMQNTTWQFGPIKNNMLVGDIYINLKVSPKRLSKKVYASLTDWFCTFLPNEKTILNSWIGICSDSLNI